MFSDILQRAESIRLDTDLLRKGRLLENFIEELFVTIPGLEVYAKDVKNDKNSQEIDISIWNDKERDGLHFLDHIILIECKNWKSKAAASDLSWFDRKMKDGQHRLGFFVSANGITGSPTQNSAAYDIVLSSYKEGRAIIVITLYEIKHLTSYRDLVQLIKRKMCEMAIGKLSIKTRD